VDDLKKLLEHARGASHAGRRHVFLGSPWSDGCDKTTVEPGNVFSPGVWTCGIGLWFDTGSGWRGVGELDDDAIEWGFDRAFTFAPVLVARYRPALSIGVEHECCQHAGPGSEGVDFHRCHVDGTGDCRIAVVITGVGPAGGRVHSLRWHADERRMVIDGAIHVDFETAPDAVEVDDAHDPAACLVFEPELGDAGAVEIAFKVSHRNLGKRWAEHLPLNATHEHLAVDAALELAREGWRTQVPAQVFAPDARIARCWNACAHHLLAAAECGAPRLGAVNYPSLWLRDAVAILRAFDLLGRHDLARTGNHYLATLYFGGGFGAEADAPGQGIWSLVRHALIGGDRDWLRRIFPHVRERTRWLDRMRTATDVIRVAAEGRHPGCVNSPGVNVLCLPAENGLIDGRMDWGRPRFYLNCWAAGGFRWAARAARELGEGALAETWEAAAAEVDALITEHLLADYGNDRDAAVAPYPSDALAEQRAVLATATAAWFRAHRIDAGGGRIREPLWPYFEIAQTHNALRCGLHEEAWRCLGGLLDDDADTYAWGEGRPGGSEHLPYRNDREGRGWLGDDAVAGNLPHGWAAAEMVACLREVFVREEHGELLLGPGVPPAWREPGSSFGVEDLPTDLGPVTYRVGFDDDGQPHLEEYDGPDRHRLALPSVS